MHVNTGSFTLHKGTLSEELSLNQTTVFAKYTPVYRVKLMILIKSIYVSMFPKAVQDVKG